MNDHLKQLREIGELLEEKNKIAAARWEAFEKARDGLAGKGFKPGDSGPSVSAAEQIHLEYAHAASEVKELEARREGVMRQITGSAGPIVRMPGISGKSIGERAMESFDLRELQRSGALESDHRQFTAKLANLNRHEVKALVTGASDTSAGAFVSPDRGGYVQQPQRRSRILDLVTIGDTDSDAIEYARQTAFTNVAAEVAEATSTTTGTKPEATIAFEKITETVKTLAHWLPATRRALADPSQLRTILDNQLRYGLTLRLENQIVNGDGTGENLTGILNTSGILSQAKGSDSVADAIFKAITQLRLGYVEPSGVAIHPTDWQVIRLARDDSGASAGTGGYLFGPPSMAGAEQIWGLPVAVTTAVPDDTAIVGDWSQFVLWLREGAQIYASDSHDDFFVKNLIALLCEMRAAAGVLLPAAFARVTSVD